MANVDVLTKITINAPIGAVREFASNPDNAPTWYDNIKSVEWVTSPPIEVGSKVAFVAHFLGKRLAYTYEFVTLDETTLVMRTSEGPFPMETTYSWSETSDGQTEMTLRNRGVATGFNAIMRPVMERMMRKANQKDLAKLKEICEAERWP